MSARPSGGSAGSGQPEEDRATLPAGAGPAGWTSASIEQLNLLHPLLVVAAIQYPGEIELTDAGLVTFKD